ncbi:SMF family protein [Haloarcula hispanica]|uniref:SMF family protein n=1 Tax=Haloarcula hispanica TaxID=51589 RepID=A0A5J5LMU0_HALHI|nr:DNA-processing protein DprA [Haloarcula hispanica]KAA9410967.1 SMF family protein [Haloarcula hispanica]
MDEFKTVIAALNDDQTIKSRSLIRLLFDFLEDVENDDPDLNDLVKFLHNTVDRGNQREKEICKKAIAHLNEIDISEYVEYLDEIESDGIRFLPFYSVVYPQQLWKIEDPPFGLYIDGSTSALFGGIAIVGTREAKSHRKEYIRSLAGKLAEEGYPIVSGLASGIDTAAHEGAIEADGQTTAVLPGGIQTIRPASNKELGEKIPGSGALVAEVSDKERIHRGRFVERNRITSGLSISVIIGASGETGGTIRQAEFAQEQCRPRYLYDPENGDGQSPKKLDELGFNRFSSTDELLEMLDSDWREPSTGPGFQQEFTDFS